MPMCSVRLLVHAHAVSPPVVAASAVPRGKAPLAVSETPGGWRWRGHTCSHMWSQPAQPRREAWVGTGRPKFLFQFFLSAPHPPPCLAALIPARARSASPPGADWQTLAGRQAKWCMCVYYLAVVHRTSLWERLTSCVEAFEFFRCPNQPAYPPTLLGSATPVFVTVPAWSATNSHGFAILASWCLVNRTYGRTAY